MFRNSLIAAPKAYDRDVHLAAFSEFLRYERLPFPCFPTLSRICHESRRVVLAISTLERLRIPSERDQQQFATMTIQRCRAAVHPTYFNRASSPERRHRQLPNRTGLWKRRFQYGGATLSGEFYPRIHRVSVIWSSIPW